MMVSPAVVRAVREARRAIGKAIGTGERRWRAGDVSRLRDAGSIERRWQRQHAQALGFEDVEGAAGSFRQRFGSSLKAVGN